MSEHAIPSRVLIVEDDPSVSDPTEAMLTAIGVEEVRTAASVAQAMDALDRWRFDLALLDLKLGEESGLTVAERCFAEQIPVVFTTGYGDLLLPERYGHVKLLRKPYTLDEMERTIK